MENSITSCQQTGDVFIRKKGGVSAHRKVHKEPRIGCLHFCLRDTTLGPRPRLGLGLPEDTSMPYPYNRIGQVAGWLYFSAWSLSFYPQTYLNWKRQSVVGFSFDFALVNPIGFLCYSIYNLAFAWSSSVRKAYAEHHHGAQSAVHANDVFFSVHAFVIATVMLIQCGIYERGGQRISPLCLKATIGMVLASVVYAILIVAIPGLSILNFLYFLSYLKLVITLFKYSPQAWLNYKRRSTVGWNIGTVLLDIFGGLLSLFQLFLEAVMKNDWSSVTGDPVKFGLGFVSVAFDIIFMVQHYILPTA
ncbi:hypothetical protein WJX72_011439 [[Myrmecia] bisecta]|uniref:Cystinosin n=1 Tax=[Myrmecia] bisecta TaxID=41462 RepID=A0AAW1R9N2_9CHLO